ncbi:DNA helicase PcrA [Serinibacter salmoneus]|uniref:ATP-dependent DNA helicase n=1 Tax=Serinibacter salmoneus TaxID=556530 RepID=A0A2A9CYD5_9MICO|nr:DNA helicase PcrA [Serinibacter salmoneus]PFG19025.1 ATP-dependent DNA helicase PcrA [Serinibacter salmoneus]
MTTLFDDLPQPGGGSAVTAAGATLPGISPLARSEAGMDGGDGAASPRGGGRRRSAQDLLEGLNPQQKEAVTHRGDPLLIIAGAGSGKTRVLTHRIAHLLATGEARPGEILAITFTNKAAAEMRERVEELVGPAARVMWVSTFHSACVRILRREHKALGLRSSFSIYDAADSQRLMQLVCKELNLDPKKVPPKAISNKVSDLKNELIDADDFARTVTESNSFDQALAAAYRAYQERLRQAHALDFDDLIATTVHLLRAFPAIAENYRRRFRHVLVDEYQDTNHAQYVLVKELAGVANPESVEGRLATWDEAVDGAAGDDPAGAPGGAAQGAAGSAGSVGRVPPGQLTVVGDADQSIYAFRGATIRNILEFEEDYPQARTILLEQNYRSTQNILSAANAVIARNPDRRKKNLWTAQGAGAKVIGYVADSDHDEARFVAEEIDSLGDNEGVKPGDVAIFYRTNAQSRALEEVLIRTGIPYKVVGGTRFYERKEVKDAIAYLRAIANPDDAVNLRRILNVPKRAIGDRTEGAIAWFAERERISFGAALERYEEIGMPARASGAVGGFAELMFGLRELAASGATPAEILDAALDRSGYLAELRASDDPQDASRVENLAELHAVAAEFSEGEPEGDLADFLERVALVADADQIPEHDGGGVVTMMTVHTAKGLEFPVVFVTGLEDGTFPHQRSLADTSELSEERRLAYVALTRARERLYLTRAALRTSYGMPNQMPASRFLDDIPADVMDWRREESATEAMRGGWGGGYGSGYGRGGGYRSGGGYGGYETDDTDGGYVYGSGSGGRGSSGRGTGAGGYGSGGYGSGGYGSGRRGSTGPRTGVGSGGGTGGGGARGKSGAADVPSLAIGDRVNHDSYGMGTVVAVEGAGSSSVAKIDFGSAGTKRLLLRYSPVSKL